MATLPNFTQPPSETGVDHRLYATDSGSIEIRLKKSGEKGYCYHRFPGEEHFHLLMGGEVYVQLGEQKICLECALRLGYLTSNRLHWQTKQRDVKRPIV